MILRIFFLSSSSAVVVAAAAAAGLLAADSLWDANSETARRCLHHPWVLALGAGVLPHASFAAYVAQDAYFLIAFARAYGRAIGKCDDIECISTLHALLGAVTDELKLHRGYAARWGANIDGVSPIRATSAYTQFLTNVSASPDTTVVDVLAAMAPCMSLYAYIGSELAKVKVVVEDGPYKEWVDAYASPDFHEAAKKIEGLLGKGPWRRAPDYYAEAMRLEFDFFDAQSLDGLDDDRARRAVADLDASLQRRACSST
ncbi:hypothetical protein CTAYLR_008407 [Chrysophaeum taylorii]|uniref:Thiaminase-2/PQQC domain-containing protein n=1 Tax=Chrysophaeum taylorii TaxID=2483200 RepID=A0AAD7UL38_9STRA|nr:hypothetical protein CTAYLR_008407 [Chrysophaeum taylorii]